MKSVCVFCGSNLGNSEVFADAARETAKVLVEQNYTVVYGGGNIGLMGILADHVRSLDGAIIGVIPRSLMAKEVGHRNLTELHVVETMHERKQLMYDLSDAFIALPGGLGTLEELFEIVTWAQLGMHTKACGLLNVAGYFDDLLRFLDHGVASGFFKQKHRELIMEADTPEALLEKFATYQAPKIRKWIKKGEV